MRQVSQLSKLDSRRKHYNVNPWWRCNEILGTAFDACSKSLANRAIMNDSYWLLDGKEFKDSCKTIHRFVNHFVEIAMEEGS